jgi:hypothetical protein
MARRPRDARKCGKDPARIVAYEPIGLVAERPEKEIPPRPSPPKPLSRKQLEAHVAELEAELEVERRRSSSKK